MPLPDLPPYRRIAVSLMLGRARRVPTDKPGILEDSLAVKRHAISPCAAGRESSAVLLPPRTGRGVAGLQVLIESLSSNLSSTVCRCCASGRRTFGSQTRTSSLSGRSSSRSATAPQAKGISLWLNGSRSARKSSVSTPRGLVEVCSYLASSCSSPCRWWPHHDPVTWGREEERRGESEETGEREREEQT